jgi:hypothetical protein
MGLGGVGEDVLAGGVAGRPAAFGTANDQCTLLNESIRGKCWWETRSIVMIKIHGATWPCPKKEICWRQHTWHGK